MHRLLKIPVFCFRNWGVTALAQRSSFVYEWMLLVRIVGQIFVTLEFVSTRSALLLLLKVWLRRRSVYFLLFSVNWPSCWFLMMSWRRKRHPTKKSADSTVGNKLRDIRVQTTVAVDDVTKASDLDVSESVLPSSNSKFAPAVMNLETRNYQLDFQK